MSAVTAVEPLRCHTCHHFKALHVATLYGVVCEGREWHWTREQRCMCEGFVAAGSDSI